jgi:hypothetical protein
MCSVYSVSPDADSSAGGRSSSPGANIIKLFFGLNGSFTRESNFALSWFMLGNGEFKLKQKISFINEMKQNEILSKPKVMDGENFC